MMMFMYTMSYNGTETVNNEEVGFQGRICMFSVRTDEIPDDQSVACKAATMIQKEHSHIVVTEIGIVVPDYLQ